MKNSCVLRCARKTAKYCRMLEGLFDRMWMPWGGYCSAAASEAFEFPGQCPGMCGGTCHTGSSVMIWHINACPDVRWRLCWTYGKGFHSTDKAKIIWDKCRLVNLNFTFVSNLLSCITELVIHLTWGTSIWGWFWQPHSPNTASCHEDLWWVSVYSTAINFRILNVTIIRCCTTRLQSSFFHQAMRLYNESWAPCLKKNVLALESNPASGIRNNYNGQPCHWWSWFLM